jgi:hypothetical protein
MKAVCPQNKDHTRFSTVAHVAETWIVDEDGHFICVLHQDEVTHGPHPDNTWECIECGAEAEVEY